MIKTKYFDSNYETHIICSVENCNNLVATVTHDEEGGSNLFIRDTEANVFCGNCSAASLELIRIAKENEENLK